MFFFDFLKLKRVQVLIFLLGVFSLALCFVPLFNVLGYEFCLALSLLVSLAGAHLGSVSIANFRRKSCHADLVQCPNPAQFFLFIGRIIFSNLSLLILPLLIISLNAFRVKNCNFQAGFAFFFLMPVLSLVFSSILGSLFAILFRRPLLAAGIAILTIFFSIGCGLAHFYMAPPIFGYDPFAGYFPGALYDEDVSIPVAFIFYRLYNASWAVFFLYVAFIFFDESKFHFRLQRHHPKTPYSKWPWVIVFLSFACGLTLFIFRSHAGFYQNSTSIQHALGGVSHSTHFEIFYPSEMDPEERDLLIQDHEFRYAQLSALLKVTPLKIRSYIFRTAEEKQTLMGASHTSIAKPWRKEIYLQQNEFPHPVLKHELAHIFSSEFGDPLLGISSHWRMTPFPHPKFNMGLVEGVAVASDFRSYGELDLHQMAAALIQSGLAPSPASLFGYGFFTEAASRGYVLAGSFCRYLLDKYGTEKIKLCYRSSGDFERIYGHSLTSLFEKYLQWLKTIKIPIEQTQLAREHFRRPSLFNRVCGHEVANLLSRAFELRFQKKSLDAIPLLERICQYDSEEPEHLLQLMQAYLEADKMDAAKRISEKLLRNPDLTPVFQREVMELLGDMAWRKGDCAAAEDAYKKASQFAGPPSARRAITLKQWALKQPANVQEIARSYSRAPSQSTEGWNA